MTVHEDYVPYKVHPLADALPLIEGEEFDQLVADVRAHGLTHPITLSCDESTILDGRNRYRACTAALVDPSFTTVSAAWDENAVARFIIGANVLRRHLNPGQRAFVALVAEEYFAELAKRRQAQAPGQPRGVKQSSVPADLRSADRRQRESSEQAAKLTGASGRGVQQAKAVSKSPDLAEQVKAGKPSLDNAHTQHQQREKAAPKPAPVKPSATMLTLRTSDGTAVEYPQPKAKAKFNRTEGEGDLLGELVLGPGHRLPARLQLLLRAGNSHQGAIPRYLPGRVHAVVPPRATRRAEEHPGLRGRERASPT